MKVSSQIILGSDGIYVETTARKRVGDIDKYIKDQVEEKSRDASVVFKNISREDGLNTNMHVTSRRILFARRFALGPLALPAYPRESGCLSITGQSSYPRTRVVYDKSLFPDMKEAPIHWLVYDASAKKVLICLVHDGRTYHPMLPNVFDNGELCTGTSFVSDIENIMKDKIGATIFDQCRAAFSNLNRTPWNDDLNACGFDRISHSEGKINPISVHNLKEISNERLIPSLFV